jgi:hypothetical protein
MTAAVTPPGYCGHCTAPRQGSHQMLGLDVWKNLWRAVSF